MQAADTTTFLFVSVASLLVSLSDSSVSSSRAKYLDLELCTTFDNGGTSQMF